MIYIMPVQQVLLEDVLKLGEVIFFSGAVKSEDISISNLSDYEKSFLKCIVQKNEQIFNKFNGMSYILIFSKYNVDLVIQDVTILDMILSEADRSLDFVRIKECPYKRPEYFIGIAGLERDIRYIIAVDEDFRLSLAVEGKRYYYLMQKGLGLDITAREESDPELYSVLYSDRTDEVYCRYRLLITEACYAFQICDDSRCFVYLFSKIDGMGLCDTDHFSDVKRRILSIISKNQKEFDMRSNQLYFYSKEIRTELVHKGKKITDLISLEEARKINQLLFNTIIEFCCAVIQTNIYDIGELKQYISDAENKFTYSRPNKKELLLTKKTNYLKTTYIAFIDGLEVGRPSKRGDYILLPSCSTYGYSYYYKNYVAKDTNAPCDEIFDDFSIEDFENIIEIIYRLGKYVEEGSAIIIGYNLPRLSMEEIASPIIREEAVDHICNNMNIALYYDMLNQGELINDDILPPRIGIKDQIRAVFEFVEYEEELYIRPIPGRVYGQYYIPDNKYKCITTYADDIYNVLFNAHNEIDYIYRDVLVNTCESDYIADSTQRVCYLFDIFDSLDPRNYDGKKAIKYVFTFLSGDQTEYRERKQEFEGKREKYRNPILHGGKNIYEIESNDFEVKNLMVYLKNIIIDFCLMIKREEISSMDVLDEELKKHQKRLGLI